MIILLAFFSGCASFGPTNFGPTKPNIPYEGPYPERFAELAKTNPLLAVEMGKLPEIQDGISESESSALNRIADIYNTNPEHFDSVFKEMYKVGLPNVRRYCSPLQALFWMAEDGKLIDNKDILTDYSLGKLLGKAWIFKNPRWNTFSKVIGRLNAPELIDYYERSRFTYHYVKSQRPEDDYDYYYVFKTNRGHCVQITAFTVYCLHKGGYKAREHHVDSPSGRHLYHAVCLFEWNGKKYIMDNGRPDKSSRRGIIPFDEYNPFHDKTP